MCSKIPHAPSNSLSKWIISKGRHSSSPWLDFQNLFLSLEKRKNGLCVGHLLKKNEAFFSQLPPGMEEKEKLDKKLHQMLVDLAKVKANVIHTNKNVWNCILDIQPARHVFIEVLFCNGPSIFSLKASKIFH